MNFNERMIFELEKEQPVLNSRTFKKRIIKNYNIEPSSDLYREITNYQINKYCCVLTKSNFVEKMQKQTKNKRNRENNNINSKELRATQRFIERVSKNDKV